MNDHTGKPVPFAALSPAEHTATGSGLKKRLRSPAGHRLLLGTIICIVALFGGPVPVLLLDLHPALILAPFFLSLIGLLQISNRLETLRQDAAIEYRLSVGLCPSCVYGLTGVPAKADGLTICPECSAAWKLGQIK
jgi:hypothetical protein